MASHADDASGTETDAAPVTDRVHHTSWSANLEGPRHADDRDLVVAEARRAVELTAAGNHVNLVTHGDHGHPETYLFDALRAAFGDGSDGTDPSGDGDADVTGDRSVTWRFVDRCGCGGYVTRVSVE